jgi:hypothetical protein
MAVVFCSAHAHFAQKLFQLTSGEEIIRIPTTGSLGIGLALLRRPLCRPPVASPMASRAVA